MSFKAFLPDPTSALLLYLEDLQINCPNNHLKTSGVARLADNLSKDSKELHIVKSLETLLNACMQCLIFTDK